MANQGKDFKKREGLVSVTIVDDPDEVKRLEQELGATDEDIEEIEPATSYPTQRWSSKIAFPVNTTTYVLISEGRVKVVSVFEIENSDVEINQEMAEAEICHWMNRIQQSLFVLLKDKLVSGDGDKKQSKDESDGESQ